MKVLTCLKFCSKQTNYVDFSRKCIEQLNQPLNNESLLRVDNNGEKAVFTWSGKILPGDESYVVLNTRVACLLQWKEGCELLLEVIDDDILPSDKITVQPTSIDEWNIIDKNSSLIESTLLNQILVVKTGLTFPVFLTASTAINVQVVSTQPEGSRVKLLELTEVHVLPPSQQNAQFKTITHPRPSDDYLVSHFVNFTGLNSHFEIRQSSVQESSKTSIEKSVAHISCEAMFQPVNRLSNERLNEKVPLYTAFTCVENKSLKNTCCNKDSFFEVSPSGKENDIKIVVKLKLIPKEVWNKLFGCDTYNYIFTCPLVLKQFQLSNGAALALRCFHDSIKKPQGLLLHYKRKLSSEKEKSIKKTGGNSDTCGLSSKNIELSFRRYLESWSSNESIVLNQGTFVPLEVDNEIVSVVVEIIGILNDVSCIISKKHVKEVFIDVEKDQSEEIDEQTLSCPQKSQTKNRVVEQLVEIFCRKPNKQNRFQRHTVLLHGSGATVTIGCGKSHLLKLIETRFRGDPLFRYVVTVKCAQLRGKKAETINDMWEEAMREGVEHRPSVVLFDDIDALFADADISQDGNAFYLNSWYLCETFVDLLGSYADTDVIATCSHVGSLHQRIMPLSNCHIFTHYINIQDTGCNFDLFKTTLRRTASDMKYSVTFDITGECEKKLNQKFEGSNIKDFDVLAKKLVFGKLSEGKTFNITDKDFKLILETYKPFSMHNVNLHDAKPAKWSDIGGLNNIKETLTETLLWPTMYPDLFKNCPIRMSSGVLLYGAPGTGKTMLASAVAHESHLNFISVKGPELLSKYVGSSENNVRDVFIRATAAKPCIVFFDELDALAPRRGHDNTGVTDRVVNQILTQLDGVEALQGVYVLAATSRPDLIDPALLRPGRLDKKLFCPLPDAEERAMIIDILLKDVEMSDKLPVKELAEKTEHFSGADLKAMFVNARIHRINSSDFQGSICLRKEDVYKALETLAPSVGEDEQIKYNQIYGSFSTSRPTTTTTPEQKVTFA